MSGKRARERLEKKRRRNIKYIYLQDIFSINRYLKSTIGNISLIDRFRKKNEEADVAPEEQIFSFWMDYFVEATKPEVGDSIRFPVS